MSHQGGIMTNLNEIYKCTVCGNMVEVVHASAGELSCCGKPMHKMVAGETDGAAEKHVPVLEKTSDGYHIQVGSVPHPATAEHHIEFIEVISNDKKYLKRKHLKPNEQAELTFKCECKEGFYIRNYCNIHGVNNTNDEKIGEVK